MSMNTGQDHMGLCERDRINLTRFTRWSLLFTLFFIVAVLFLPVEGGIHATPAWRLALAVLPLFPGYLAVQAFINFMQQADELIRHIHYEAAAKSFYIVVVLGFLMILASQVFGQWEDSGVILWIIGYFTYLRFVKAAWKQMNV